MSFYFYLNLAIIAFPLLFSFERRIKFYKRYKALAFAILVVGIVFVACARALLC
jgi:hypothetical protein